MEFKESTNKPTVKALEFALPQIIISPLALDKMKIYVHECDQEVGWLGTAVRNDKVIHIMDMFLFEQEVSAVTTDITEEGLSSFGEGLLQQADGVDIWNNLKVWGHSHVNMATSPSGTDDDQMDTFSECQHEWFVRIIGNKLGSLRVDLYDYKLGIIYSDMPWVTGYSDEELQIYNAIVMLEEKLAMLATERLTTITDPIIAEIKTKVKKKQWGYATTPYTPTNTPTSHGAGATSYNNVRYLPTSLDENMITDNDDIKSYFEDDILLEIGQCDTWKEVLDLLEANNFDRFFTTSDIAKIWNYGKARVGVYYFGRKDV